MSSQNARTANLLGAATLALYDELHQAVERIPGRSGESPAAIVALGHQPGLSNDGLSRLLGLTHTGTVRLVDRLVDDGLVERKTAPSDKRGVALHLTADGELVRRKILEARRAVMEPLVAALGADEQETLAALLGKLLQSISRNDLHKLRICRLCDGGSCDNCPIHVPVG